MSKRPFQFHLSTALIAVVVVGAFIGLNMRPERAVVETIEGTKFRTSKTYSLGWPLTFYSSNEWKEGAQDRKYYASGNNQTENMWKFFANLILCAIIIAIFARLADHFMSHRKQSEAKDSAGTRRE
jgi:CDP-diglyceride synthetase